MALGTLINYGVYILIVLSFSQLNYGYIVASAAGSATAMMVNFLNMNFIIFRRN